jgi:lipoprotein-anchoring transpeptidase ErfK/SrfK
MRRPDGLWVRVRLAELPNNHTGWVRRDALGGYQFVRTHLVIDRTRLRAVLYSNHKAVFRAPIAIGRPDAPTPAGSFYVVDRLDGFGDPFYGPVAFGTSARSATLTDWPGGGVIGIHGTNRPDLIPGRVSHGCIRMRNPDILRLRRLLPIGTPLTIR